MGNWRFWSHFFDWGVWRHRNQNLTQFPDVVFNSGKPIQDLPLSRLFAKCYLLVWVNTPSQPASGGEDW